jgi:glycerophosphoryl diester phosphodiesterase family protein
MVEAPHPQSVICTAAGHEVQLKVHQCIWSGDHPGNSLPAIQECYRAHVARAEIDVAMLKDEDFLVVHDLDLAVATDGAGWVDKTRRCEIQRLHLSSAGAPADACPKWRERLVRALDMGVDVITTETPRELAQAFTKTS